MPEFIKSVLSSLYQKRDLPNLYLFLIFGAYLILLTVTISRHEPWIDEAQAWLLVSDFSLIELFTTYLRYEGHPGLWYLLLFLPAKLGLPYFSINILAGLFAALGTWLFLRYAPFPTVIKVLYPFTYFAFYQYGVIARSYCLIPSLLFLTAIIYRKRMEHPFLFVALLCLLSNVSVHIFLMAGAFLFVHFLSVVKIWRQLDKRTKINQIAAFFLFALSAIQIIAVLAPPPDQGFAVGNNFGLLNFFEVSNRMVAGSLIADETSRITWTHYVLSLLILFTTLLWLYQKKLTLLYLLPLLLILSFMAVKYTNVWHQGILFFLWIFVLWISFEDHDRHESPKIAPLVLAMITVVFGVQVYWSVYAIQHDWQHNYSGSRAVARYIKENELEHQKIYASGWKSVAITPYFSGKVFYNHNQDNDLRIWFWSARNQTAVGFNERIREIIAAEQPETVIFAADHLDPNIEIELEGYGFNGYFDGNIYWKSGIYEADSFRLFRKSK